MMSELKWLRPSAYRKELHGKLMLILLLKNWDALTGEFQYMISIDKASPLVKSLASLAKAYAGKGNRIVGFIPVPDEEPIFEGPEEKTPWDNDDESDVERSYG